MIQNPLLSRYRQSESIQFFGDISTICANADPALLQIEAPLNDLIQVNTEINDSFKTEQGSAITQLTDELDGKRDKLIVGLRTIVEGFTYHYDGGKQAAAVAVLHAIDKYGSGISRMNRQAETTVLTNLCNDLVSDAVLVAHIATLGLAEWVTQLDDANKAFNEAFLNRNKEIADKDTTATGELLKVAAQKFDVLVAHITAHATLTPSVEYTSLVNQINALIDKYNTTANLRDSKE